MVEWAILLCWCNQPHELMTTSATLLSPQDTRHDNDTMILELKLLAMVEQTTEIVSVRLHEFLLTTALGV
jgi:urease gamma subunit